MERREGIRGSSLRREEPPANPASPTMYGLLGLLLGLPHTLRSEAELAGLVESGLSVGAVHTLRSRIGLSDAEVSDLIAPRRTLARRASLHQPLSRQEADGAVRLGRITARAQQVFAGKPDYVGEWLRTANSSLNDRTPLQTLATDPGARAVEELLIAVDCGMF